MNQSLISMPWVCASCARRLTSSAAGLHSTSSPITSLWRSKAIGNLERPSRRMLHTSTSRLESSAPRQAVPLGDFYTDLLSTPLPKQDHTVSPLPVFVQSGDETKEERARKLFGTMERYRSQISEEPDATWRTINGVPVPPRPGEPDNCCMSGCVHCVWDDYRDEVEAWAERLKAAKAKAPKRGTDNAIKATMPRTEVSEASTSMDDDGGGSEGLWTEPSTDPDSLFQEIPVGIRAFMATEKKLKEKKRAKKEL
ncbi:hypothetical protein B0A52_08623 [Exophiala mesophila]|uniref:Oxidoreductase-like domain-containing protein n=1 Tax=Exophiala mesophila TaxID=212818 RepID=A0A438MU48_EXOME|nr:hypothetical protein B0A52_08623 [Exophiala mesophila]